jgi:hypothetical protein
MEQSTQKRALGLKDKIPDIQKTLETVQFLKSRDVRLSPICPAGVQTNNPQDDDEPLETSFELNDTLFAKANIEKVDEVYLWLGVCIDIPARITRCIPRPPLRH